MGHCFPDTFSIPSRLVGLKQLKQLKMKLFLVFLASMALVIASSDATREDDFAEEMQKRQCDEIRKPYPSNGKTGNNACIAAYWDAYKMSRWIRVRHVVVQGLTLIA